jgi:hypothetical protein
MFPARVLTCLTLRAILLHAGEGESDVGSAKGNDGLYPRTEPWTGSGSQPRRRALILFGGCCAGPPNTPW